MSYIDDHVLTYIDKKMSYIEPDLVAVRAYGLANKVPIITNDGAAFLRSQIILKKPTKILEVGTAIGFSGSLMLLNSQAQLTTIELDEGSFKVAENNFKSLGLSQRVVQHLGDASLVMQVLVDADQTYDFIFIDAAKGQYLDYFLKAEKMIVPGGMIMTDNVLYKGIVAGLPFPRRNKTIYTRLNAFIDYTSHHGDFYSSLMSVGDGIMLSIRKEDT